ncbi:MAG: PIN domain-containing protein [Dethiobacter sp.]|jgi:predicted nucleic acid-binding protein|nr:MAG: PIN domain-containing protein [Dethiobacter sp.]
MKIIVDTSIWIEYFKKKAEIVAFIDRELLAGTTYMVGPVVSELLQGVKTEKELDSLLNCIDAVPFIESNIADWRLAGSISFRLRKDGLTIPLTDLLIAAVSINNGAYVYSPDHHFILIPDVLLYKPSESN